MQTWSISYTADKQKAKNRSWMQGKMNYNLISSLAHFYDEEGILIDKMKIEKERIAYDTELTLKRHLIEIGRLEVIEESSEEVVSRLNKELGILTELECKTETETETETETKTKTKTKTETMTQNPNQIVSKAKVKIPTILSSKEPKILYDILYTRDKQKKTKLWHDGLLKYHPNLKLGEFYTELGILMYKKVMEAVPEGTVLETSNLFIEICGKRARNINGDDIDELNKAKDKECTEVLTDKENRFPNRIPNRLPNSLPNSLPNRSVKNQIETSPLPQSIFQTKSQNFNILYTKDKQKKAKKWLDGRLDYNNLTGLAKFYTLEEDGNVCFYKKVMEKGAAIEEGSEFESGIFIFQIDNEMIINITDKVEITNDAKKVKTDESKCSIVASEEFPLDGRSDDDLLALIRSP